MDDFSVKRESRENVAVVTVSGRIDSVTANTLDAELAEILHDNKKIVLDLKGVVYMSTAGARAIVRASQSAKKSAGDVKLASMQQPVMQVLETAGMMRMLTSYPSVDEAVASFQ